MASKNRGVFGLNLGHLWSQRPQRVSQMRTPLDEVHMRRRQPLVAAAL